MNRRLLPYGETAVLVEFDDPDDAVGLARALGRLRLPRVVDLVPGATTLLVRLDAPPTDALVDALRTTAVEAPDATTERVIEVSVHYDGEDLADVASLLGLTTQNLVSRHTASTWHVQFLGFAPGFAYLTSPDAGLDVPRRASPRSRVPAGSVALAGTWSGVYPRDSPGGWQLIGRTDFVAFDPGRVPAVGWRAGDRVRFVDADRPEPADVR